MPEASREFLIRVKADIEKAVREMDRLTRKIDDQGRAAEKENKQVGGLSRQFSQLAVAASAYLSVQSAIKALRMADEYGRIQSQIRLATKATGDYISVSKQLFDIAQRNGVALQGTVSLFANISRASRELGASNEDVLKVTEAIQQLAAMSGTGQGALANAMLQFGQAMAAGVVRAEEFNSILENTPVVADRIAKGLGLTLGQLRRAVVEGQVLSKDVFAALLGQAPDIAKEMADIPDSLGRSTQRLSNSMAQFLGRLDQATDATGVINANMRFFSGLLDSASNALEEQTGLSAQLNDLQLRRLNLLKKIAENEAEITRLAPRQSVSLPAARLLAANRVGLERNKKLLAEVESQLVKTNKLALAQTQADGTEGPERIDLNTDAQQNLSDTLDDVNARLARQTKLFEAQAEAATTAKERVADLSASFDRAQSQLTAPAPGAGETSGLDIQQIIARSRQALAGGDLQSAVDGAESARDLIVDVARAGTESQSVLKFLLGQAKAIGVQAAQALADQQAAAAKQVQVTLADLQARAKELQLIKVGFDQETAAREAASLRASLQSQFDANPLVMPVVLQGAVGANGDGPTRERPIPRVAGGGLLRGPGNGTSDSILARLSNGEYVMRADAAKHYGKDLLDKMNAMSLPRFARGGAADLSNRILSGSAMPGGSGRSVNLYLNNERFQVSADGDTTERMIRTFDRQALKQGRRA